MMNSDKRFPRLGKVILSRFPEPTAVSVSIERTPEYMQGLTALFVSDVHLRRSVSNARLDSLIQLIAVQKADLLLLGGDYGEGEAQCLRFFRALKPVVFPLGSFAVPGNNDSNMDLERITAENGVKLLKNRASSIKVNEGVLHIGGCDDCKYGTPDASKLFTDCGAGYRILLGHYPVDYKCECDLQLSGHTHGGQTAPFGFTPYHIGFEHHYRIRAVRGIRKLPDRTLFVGNGIGISKLPVRIGADPEFYVLRFKK